MHVPTRPEIEDLMRGIFSDQFGVAKNEIYDVTSIHNDLGADSLDTVELSMEIEEQFDLSIPDQDSEKLQVFKQFVDYVESALQDNATTT